MAANDRWSEREPVRTGHATTSLIETTALDSDEPVRILVDPSLPPPALLARLRERTNLGPSDITHVFLTSFRPDVRRALTAFESAAWLIAEREREAVGVPLVEGLKRLAQNFDEPDEHVEAVLRADIALLQRCQAAPDQIAKGVDLFPLTGVTAGLCGLLLAGAETTVVCGDAVPTVEHLEEGRVPPMCDDREAALESLREAIEIADVMILGRDNIAINPARRGSLFSPAGA